MDSIPAAHTQGPSDLVLPATGLAGISAFAAPKLEILPTHPNSFHLKDLLELVAAEVGKVFA
jgi:hypothetical protein